MRLVLETKIDVGQMALLVIEMQSSLSETIGEVFRNITIMVANKDLGIE